MVSGQFSPSVENTLLFLSTSWCVSAGLQFTRRMAPQPLGPQTQFFCKEDRDVGSGRSQVKSLAFQMPLHIKGRVKPFSRATGTSRSEFAHSSTYRDRTVTSAKRAERKAEI